jgi:hypothetical protein
MKYLVTGAPRSGTSMMMACLAAGGIKPYYDKVKDKELSSFHPDTNHSGFFERHTGEIESFDFPMDSPEGSSVKFLKPWTRLGTLLPGEYRIIIMRRDPREILHSLAALNNGVITTGDIALFNVYPKYIQRAIDLAHNRKDILSVDVCDYRILLENPGAFFTKLHKKAWPLNVNDAVAVVDQDAVKTPLYDFPFSGDIAKDMGLPVAITPNEAVLNGTLKVSEEVMQAAKDNLPLDVVAV